MPHPPRHALIVGLAAAALAGCGGGSDAPATPEDAVRQTILTWTFEGDCDAMTDKFLETQSVIGDTREERCKYFEGTHQKPRYSEDDVKFRRVQVAGRTAVATIGSDFANVESDYHLVEQGGRWRIDEVD